MKKVINIAERLKIIASYLPRGANFADIGSDHAYLPCYICLHDRLSRAIAGEVNEGPYKRAKMTVKAYELENQIDVRLGDGLAILTERDVVEQIVIAGMGGALISEILEKGKEKLENIKRIIVQPNVDAKNARKWLVDHQFCIVDERIMEENGHIYEIIVADYKKEPCPLNEKEYIFGPILLQNKSDIFYKKWQREYEKLQQVVLQMKDAKIKNNEKISQFELELKMMEEVLEIE